MAAIQAQTYPSTHRFLKVQDIQVMAPSEPNPPDEQTVEWMKFWLFRTSDLRFIPDPRLVDYVAEYKRCTRKETVPWKNTQSFLDILFPTKYWVESGVRYKQKVSVNQVSRDELKAMSEVMNTEMQIQQSQALTGYCPIRFSLHIELFDELIRQVAINSPSRAYMLDRVRGELNQTLESYRKVLDVSLMEESKLKTDKVDAELVMIEKKLGEAQVVLKIAEEENSSAVSDYKEVMDKFELLERVHTQLHEPAIRFAKQINDALDRQLWHFENPPHFDTGDEEVL